MQVDQSCKAPPMTDHSKHPPGPTKDFGMAQKPAGGRVFHTLLVFFLNEPGHITVH